MNADNIVAEFLAEHPEYADEFGCHRELGAVMTTAGVEAFANWAVRNGRATREKADRFVRFLKSVRPQ